MTLGYPGGIGKARLNLLVSDAEAIGVCPGVMSGFETSDRPGEIRDALDGVAGTACTGLDKMVRIRTS